VPLLLDILRHGEAEPAGSGGDAVRPLSLAGRGVVAALAAGLAMEGWRHERIFSSPMLRARHTAEIVRDATPDAAAIERMDELLPERDPSDVLAVLGAHGATAGHVLLVTHQPLAGRLAALLTGDAPAFRPGTLVRIECAAGPGPGSGRLIRTVEPLGS
jgi:phosphohistidine phosphatase